MYFFIEHLENQTIHFASLHFNCTKLSFNHSYHILASEQWCRFNLLKIYSKGIIVLNVVMDLETLY